MPAILVPRHMLTNDESNLFPHSLEDLSTSVPENTSFPHNTNTLGYNTKVLKIECFNLIGLYFSLHMQHSGAYMDAVGLCSNGPPTSLESPHSVAPPTETPPPGYMSEDGDPIDHNDNMSKSYYNAFLFIKIVYK